MSESSPPTMLLVDDDDVFRERLVRAMEQRGFEVRSAASAASRSLFAVRSRARASSCSLAPSARVIRCTK